ncbi:MAG TPA: hypothetical protein VM434_07415 [Beijerinckiaceae bacterium]|nr:hypothetical protein [Beijerinckiaceae bacterium]
MSTLNDPTWWTAALKGSPPPLTAGKPEYGFFRTRAPDGGWIPVAVWQDGEGWLAKVGADPVEDDAAKVLDIFVRAAKRPISHEVYTAVTAGAPWPDIDPVVRAGSMLDRAKIDPAAPGPGHNTGEVDEAAVLKDQIEAASQGAKAYASVADDETAALAQSLRARLLELAREAETKHKAEKAPHLEMCRKIDERWLALKKSADAVATSIRTALSKWETEKARREREARERAEQERRRIEEEARKANPAAAAPPAPPPVAAPEPERPAPIRGGYGRPASVRDVKIAHLDDPIAFFPTVASHPDVIALLTKLAQRQVDAGATPPGVRVEQERRVA